MQRWLRDLPDSLLTTELSDRWMDSAKMQDESERLRLTIGKDHNPQKKKKKEKLRDFLFICIVCINVIIELVKDMPEINLAVLKELFHFLHKLNQNEKTSKMNAKNIGIVVGPNILTAGESDPLRLSRFFISIIILKKIAVENASLFIFIE